jgi:hypothetical protein
MKETQGKITEEIYGFIYLGTRISELKICVCIRLVTELK